MIAKSISNAVYALCLILLVSVGTCYSLTLELPIKCKIGKNCWITNYVNHGTPVRPLDPMCGRMTYKTHKGTDFAIRDLEQMRSGISVVAAAAGIVLAIRDGMDDISLNKIDRQSIKGKECGNGLVIRHENGFETQYCHLRKGSVIVKPGQRVGAGARLGLVGLSGFSEYPHLHFSVRKNGGVYDPFAGKVIRNTCKKHIGNIWSQKARQHLKYDAGLVYNYGVSITPPTLEHIRDGKYQDDVISKDASAIIGWLTVFSAQAGDQVIMQLISPSQILKAQDTFTIPKFYAHYFRYFGKPLMGSFWESGTWTLKIFYISRQENERNTFVKQFTVR